MNERYFTYDESPLHPNRFMISPIIENLPIQRIDGSLNLLPARLLKLTYASYLRFCRDVLGAEIIGKNSYYPVPYFKKNKEFIQFIEFLNARAKLVIYETRTI